VEERQSYTGQVSVGYSMHKMATILRGVFVLLVKREGWWGLELGTARLWLGHFLFYYRAKGLGQTGSYTSRFNGEVILTISSGLWNACHDKSTLKLSCLWLEWCTFPGPVLITSLRLQLLFDSSGRRKTSQIHKRIVSHE